MTQTKTCTDCQEEKLVAEFGPSKKGRYGVLARCRSCMNQRTKIWRQTHPKKPEIMRAWHLRNYYGLTTEQYDSLVERQNGLCAICEEPPNEKRHGYLDVDHDHSTGRVRGLLCGRCNRMIGLAQEDVERLKAAMKYLQMEPV